METYNSLSELKNLEVETSDEKSCYRNHTKSIAVTIAYLLGVQENYIHTIDSDNDSCEILLDNLNSNYKAKVIRSLNNIRSNIILNFKSTSKTIRISSLEYTPIYKMDIYKDDFLVLKNYDINIVTARQDLNEYLININKEILNHIEDVRSFFPDWIEFKYIRNMFIMPNNIKAEIEKYQRNQNLYPFKRYFNWKHPQPMGNILATDSKILEIIYRDNGTYFNELNKVLDASDNVKFNINEFIKRGEKIQIHVDGENCDPYKLAAMFDSLQDFEIQKIDKVVVYFDERFSSKAWMMLKHFTFGVDVETIPVKRVIENKSLVDHKLVAGISKAVFKDGIDSIILASSDSDFWSVIEDVDAQYLVLAESDKCGFEFKDLLRNHDIFYCYIDKFKAPEKDEFFELVFKYELEKLIKESFSLANANDMLNEAVTQSRAQISVVEKEKMYHDILSNIKLTLNRDGNYSVLLP